MTHLSADFHEDSLRLVKKGWIRIRKSELRIRIREAHLSTDPTDPEHWPNVSQKVRYCTAKCELLNCYLLLALDKLL
jgi:hypothetical protein